MVWSDGIIYLIGLSACVFALLTVISRDIFHAAMWLAMTLLSIAAIYFYLNAEFLGVIQVLVYIGGVITLFVFAIKLTAEIGSKTVLQISEPWIISAIAVLMIFGFLFKVFGSHQLWVVHGDTHAPVSLKQIGASLVTTYALPFEFISLLLLAAMVGAIILGKTKK
ncbi:MAG TPA: hypothetical protein DD723_04495 [Candidatus Omnitrophica bacterium]|nr:MAG: hypothetical protein A2Z81_03995 [Omnitrophica WOR_2 bacterium GWA2_45_18]HBR14789.1 hypothetical protein [Candidatus Omnitrophota bacterium]